VEPPNDNKKAVLFKLIIEMPWDYKEFDSVVNHILVWMHVNLGFHVTRNNKVDVDYFFEAL
jgi:hypothetical protein